MLLTRTSPSPSPGRLGTKSHRRRSSLNHLLVTRPARSVIGRADLHLPSCAVSLPAGHSGITCLVSTRLVARFLAHDHRHRESAGRGVRPVSDAQPPGEVRNAPRCAFASPCIRNFTIYWCWLIDGRLRDHSTVSVVSSVGVDDKADRGSVQWRPSSVLAPMKEDPRRQLTVLGIVGLCYFSVCGGPIGSEPIISGAAAILRWRGEMPSWANRVELLVV
jgi:hypothetical protein